MKIRYIGDAPAMSYILGKVEPGKIYEIKKEDGLKLIGGLFEEVKQEKKIIKKDGD
jgi:hypothetical protein